MPDAIVVSSLVVEWHLLRLLLLLHLHRATMSHLPRRTIWQRSWWEILMSLMWLSECFIELPRPIILTLHMDLSASTDSASSSHHSSDSSSGSVSLGYGSASRGSASVGASDDDLVNRYFAGTFPPPYDGSSENQTGPAGRTGSTGNRLWSRSESALENAYLKIGFEPVNRPVGPNRNPAGFHSSEKIFLKSETWVSNPCPLRRVETCLPSGYTSF
ncbi:hypothetical protein PIB30_045145 [Stylosanthes scabra]|uniref:Uncharacterized protein n=1 Tax=Stylosanthes scabra TaxID=79078 RepID=A0ABU6UET4_9FABA|nr:hypothetical protein [Stylosanthes scabra]